MKQASALTTPLLLVALSALLVVQQAVGVPGTGRLARGLDNALHGPWFAAVTWVLMLLFARLSKRRADRTIVAMGWALALLLALASEALQIRSDRDASLVDVVLDMLGATAALAYGSGRQGLIPVRLGAWIGAVLLSVTTAPLLAALAVTGYQHHLAPTLVRFDQPASRWLVVANSPSVRVDGALEIRLANTRWPGIALHEPIADWRGHRTLVIELDVDQALDLNVSVRLAGRDHVVREVSLEPGTQTLKLDIGSMFDVDRERVTDVVIYSRREFAGRTLRILEVRLR